MDILFINHQKSQCGIYEIGKRISSLLDKTILPIEYIETPVHGENKFRLAMESYKPKYVIVNYYVSTLPYINKRLLDQYPNTHFIGIIHDPLSEHMIRMYESTFDCWILHDDTNTIVSKNKFLTVRPVPRFERKERERGVLNIGSHGFSVSPWKMFDQIISYINSEFDEVNINMNITQATFGGGDDTHRFNEWKKIITKPKINLNLSNHYFETENELINFLSNNDLNVYFYNASRDVGIGGSADLAISSRSSLVVNSTHMYKHLHPHIGYYEQTGKLSSFLDNNNKIQELYDMWSPERITDDYKKMIETL